MAVKKKFINKPISFEKKKTKRFINNPSPDTWPLWPVFPLKKKIDSDIEVGYSIAVGKRSIVYLGNVFMIPYGVRISWIMENAEKIEYNSVEELVEDGWLGD